MDNLFVILEFRSRWMDGRWCAVYNWAS